MSDTWRKRGMRLKRIREKRGWTQEMLADKVAVSRVTSPLRPEALIRFAGDLF